MKTINKAIFNTENYGGEFSILNSYNHPKTEKREITKSKIYTAFLIALSTISLVMWIVSLNILPFGHVFQYLLGFAVLSINVLVFKWVKL